MASILRHGFVGRHIQKSAIYAVNKAVLRHISVYGCCACADENREIMRI